MPSGHGKAFTVPVERPQLGGEARRAVFGQQFGEPGGAGAIGAELGREVARGLGRVPGRSRYLVQQCPLQTPAPHQVHR